MNSTDLVSEETRPALTSLAHCNTNLASSLGVWRCTSHRKLTLSCVHARRESPVEKAAWSFAPKMVRITVEFLESGFKFALKNEAADCISHLYSLRSATVVLGLESKVISVEADSLSSSSGTPQGVPRPTRRQSPPQCVSSLSPPSSSARAGTPSQEGAQDWTLS